MKDDILSTRKTCHQEEFVDKMKVQKTEKGTITVTCAESGISSETKSGEITTIECKQDTVGATDTKVQKTKKKWVQKLWMMIQTSFL